MRKIDEIREKISEIAQNKAGFSKKELLEFFPDKKHLIEYTLKKALKDGDLKIIGKARSARYLPAFGFVVPENSLKKTFKRTEKSEDSILDEFRDEFISSIKLNENARNIVFYAFTEMVNNAIEHSQSENIEIAMFVVENKLRFTVRDFGIGAFRNIMEKKELPDQRSAIAELTKGKVTTAPKWHSGEGIFFTSRAADRFRLTSDKLNMERDNLIPDVFINENEESLVGTLVEFEINIGTDRHLAKDVFGQFASDSDEPDFGKTDISVKLFSRGDIHISRSQAKRLMSGLDKFKIVNLDFEGVPIIGQGFADEIFRIFVREHPDTELRIVNANDDVRFMIDRVEDSKESNI